MVTVNTRQGSPRPYELRGIKQEDGKFQQHAIVRCCIEGCSEIAHFPWTQGEAPHPIVNRFVSMGWMIHRAKARCPTHAKNRTIQQATHARLTEMETQRPTLVKRPPAETTLHKVVSPIRSYLMTVYDDGSVSLTDIEGAQEMLFGEKTYLVIPR